MSSESEKIYELVRYYAVALDPIHIGTGGYRIGRVDNTIVREPATEIPKIPGTSIEGVCRSYAFLKIQENESLRKMFKERIGFNIQCAKGKTKKGEEEKKPCGRCPICITFGYASDTQSLQAMALFSDARILLFPVFTMIGPVWVTSPMVLKDAKLEEDHTEKDNVNNIKFDDKKIIIPKSTKIQPPNNKLNLGWLFLETITQNTELPNWLRESGIPDDILSRVIIVPNTIFSQVVNSNLEVRTSVAIDPERGAAEEGALFTYEAIPRGTIFWFDVIYQNPMNFPMIENDSNVISKTTEHIIKTVEDGLSLLEFLGIGGMSSRGFGRLKVLKYHMTDEKFVESLISKLDSLKSNSNGQNNDEYSYLLDYLKALKECYKSKHGNYQKIIDLLNEAIGDE